MQMLHPLPLALPLSAHLTDVLLQRLRSGMYFTLPIQAYSWADLGHILAFEAVVLALPRLRLRHHLHCVIIPLLLLPQTHDPPVTPLSRSRSLSLSLACSLSLVCLWLSSSSRALGPHGIERMRMSVRVAHGCMHDTRLAVSTLALSYATLALSHAHGCAGGARV